MEWYMWILTFMVGSFFANMLLRWMYGKKHYFYQEFREQGYEQGYRDGAANVKMYYSIKGESPPMDWIKKNRGTLLDTRSKFLASLEDKN
tara:strand:- start:55 stop:324 length:270 start_codon:yes stop_codon:yes gene_type:complete